MRKNLAIDKMESKQADLGLGPQLDPLTFNPNLYF